MTVQRFRPSAGPTARVVAPVALLGVGPLVLPGSWWLPRVAGAAMLVGAALVVLLAVRQRVVVSEHEVRLRYVRRWLVFRRGDGTAPIEWGRSSRRLEIRPTGRPHRTLVLSLFAARDVGPLVTAVERALR